MVYLWESPLKFYACEDGDDLSRYIGLYNRKKGPDSALFNNGYSDGVHWDWPKEDLEFTFDTSIFEILKYDVLENNARFIIVNQRIRHVLETFAKDDIQFIPVTVICRNGMVDGYYAVNILSRVAGIDMQKSTIEWRSFDPSIEGFGCGVGGLIYKHDCLGRHHIALEKEYTFILVSQELKDALCSLNPPINEVRFVLPEDTEW